MARVENKELRDLGTHAAAATDLHETRTTEQIVQIVPPVVASPGPNDMRDEERYRLKVNGDVNEES